MTSKFDKATQAAAIETLQHVIQFLEDHPALRLGQALIVLGLAKDDHTTAETNFWNYSSQALRDSALRKMKELVE